MTAFKSKLESRKKFRNFDPATKNWHGLYSILQATFSKYKVVWREMSDGIIASVVTQSKLPNGKAKTIIPDHKLFIVPTKSKEEAGFVCTFLNSSISSFIIKSYALSTGISTHILDRLPIPSYSKNNPLHWELAKLADACQIASIRGNKKELETFEKNIDNIVAKIWKINKKELSTIRSILRY